MHKVIVATLIAASALFGQLTTSASTQTLPPSDIQIYHSPPFIEMYRIPGSVCRLQFDSGGECFAFAEDLARIARGTFQLRQRVLVCPDHPANITGHEAALIYWTIRVAIPTFPDAEDRK